MSKTTLSKKESSQSKDSLGNTVEQPPIQNQLENFKLLGRLGDGAYSQVYKVKRLEDQEVYALKKVKLNHLSDKEKENAINEVRILASIKHVNVISYKEAFIEPTTQSLCIVMEHADNGDLFQKIVDHQKAGGQFTEIDLWKIFIQIVRALRAMHDLNIMHRDLKSANVFLNKDFTVKLGDMNVSKVANQRGLNYTQTGTPYYASPEVWKDEPYDVKSDIWSLGCVLYEMTMLKPPFQSADMQGLYKRVIKGQYPRISRQFSNELWLMIKALLQVNPSQRPDAKQISNMASFKAKEQEIFQDEQIFDQGELLKTIRVPKNIMYISNKLPNANYDKKGSIKLSLNFNTLKPQSQTIKGAVYQSQQHQDVKLPSLQNTKLLINKKNTNDQSVDNISLVSHKLTSSIELKHQDYSENKSTKNNQVKIDQLINQRKSHSPVLGSSDKQSKLNENEEHHDSYDLRTPNIDVNKSVVLNSSSHHRDLSLQQHSGLSRDFSMKKLHRDQSSDNTLQIISERSLIRIEKENLKSLQIQRMNGIYNQKQQKPIYLAQSMEKRLKPYENDQSKKYLGINSQKLMNSAEKSNFMNEFEQKQQSLLQRNQAQQQQSYQMIRLKDKSQQNLKNNSSKKQQSYLQNLSRIASVYQKSSLSPIQKVKVRERSLGPYEQPSNHSVSVSISSIKLPKVHNKSVINAPDSSMVKSTMSPYDHLSTISLGAKGESQKKQQQQQLFNHRKLSNEYKLSENAAINGNSYKASSINAAILPSNNRNRYATLNKSVNEAGYNKSLLMAESESTTQLLMNQIGTDITKQQ